MTQTNEIKPVFERDPSPLREIRLSKWAVQHGDNFQSFGIGSSLSAVSKVRVAGRVNDPQWKIVSFTFSQIEFPSKDGRMNYTIELEDVHAERRPERYTFQAPGNSALEASLKAHRANERLKKTALNHQSPTTSNGQ